MDDRIYISIPQLAKLLGISRIAVYKKVKRGEIDAIRVGRNYAIATEYIHKNIVDLDPSKLSPIETVEIENVLTRVMDDFSDVLTAVGKD